MSRFLSTGVLLVAFLGSGCFGCFGSPDDGRSDGGTGGSSDGGAGGGAGGGVGGGAGGGAGGGNGDGGTDTCTSPGDRRCLDFRTAQRCEDTGVWSDVPCATGSVCDNGFCAASICTPGATRCADSATLELCNATGTAWEQGPCATPGFCQSGECIALVCSPGESRCVNDGVQETCATDGSGWLGQNCTASQICAGGQCTNLACATGETRCVNSATQETCNVDRTGWVQQTCPTPGACQSGACAVWNCTPSESRCATSTAIETCATDGSGWVFSACSSGDICSGGTCQTPVCTGGTTRCVNATEVETCRTDGSGWDKTTCGTNQVCSSTTDQCENSVCTPFDARCAASTIAETCAADGTGWVATTCNAATEVCSGGSCLTKVCTSGSAGCFDSDTLGVCNTNGTGYDAGANCPGGEFCSGGTCVADPCVAAATEGRRDGCAFTVVATVGGDTGANVQQLQVTNGGNTAANLTFTSPTGNVSTFALAANSSESYTFDKPALNDETNIYKESWTVTSDQPVFLLHGQPTDVVGTSSNITCTPLFGIECLIVGGTCNASGFCECSGILCQTTSLAGNAAWDPVLPHHALGTVYSVPAMSHLKTNITGTNPSTQDYPWAVVVTATEPGTTTVTATVAAPTDPGTSIAAGTAGGNVTFSLTQGQSARIDSVATGTPTCVNATTDTQHCTYPASDLSGTVINASQAVAVHTTSACTRVPYDKIGCDHMVAQVPPYTAVGQQYVVSPVGNGGARPHVVRVVATQNNTTVSFDPTSVAGGATLQTGDAIEFRTFEAVAITTSSPALVMRMATGRDDDADSFDPALDLVPPVTQWVRTAATGVATGYTGAELLLVGTPGGVAHNGANVPLSFIGSSGFGWAVVSAPDGYNTLTGTSPLSATLFGGGNDTTISYGMSAVVAANAKPLHSQSPDAP